MAKWGIASSIVTILFVLYACKKEEIQFQGSGDTLKNGEDWGLEVLAGIRPGTVDKATISFHGKAKGKVTWVLSFKAVPLKKGVYTNLKRSQVCGSDPLVKDTNAVCARYSDVFDHGEDWLVSGGASPMQVQDSCWIEITSLDTISGNKVKVKGLFYGTFIEDSLSLHAGHPIPDTIRFEQGSFQCKFEL